VVTTEGWLLGGRVRYRQPAIGFRSGIEPVLLAAAVSARGGEHVLEAGTGAGAALLCLTSRVPGVVATGIEADAAMAGLAAENARDNGFTGIEIITGRVETAALPGLFDHAIANPPYHQAGGSASPVAGRETAKRGSETLIPVWVGRLGAALRGRGSLTLIVPAGMVASCLAAMTASRCPCTSVFPLWPKAGRPAKLVLLRGTKDARTPMRLMAGMVLHQADGAFTEAAKRLLEDAAALPLERQAGVDSDQAGD
jgi:tRNA1Val (adenine37-N6)-methyltransferase